MQHSDDVELAVDGGSEPVDDTDARQNRQLARLSRRVLFAWVAAAVGPILALGGVVFTGLQWAAAQEQLVVMRSQLKDARDGAAQAQRDTERALSIAESQAVSLSKLANAGTMSAEMADRQWQSMERQIGVMREQLVDARKSASQAAVALNSQFELAKVQTASMQTLADATKDVAAGATESSAAAKQTIAVLERTMQLDQRPWLALQDIKIRRFPWALGRPYKLQLEFKNVGRTPAHNVNVAVIREVSPTGYPSLGYHPDDSHAFNVLSPGQAFTLTPWARAGRSLRWASSDSWSTYIHGFIDYKDDFGRNHRLSICYRYVPNDGTLTGCGPEERNDRGPRYPRQVR